MLKENNEDKVLLIYGATGYTGRLICQEAARRGLTFEIAGRNPDEVAALAKELNVPYHVFSVDDEFGWTKSLLGKTTLLNVAGPFSETAEQAMNACIKYKVHYTDITAEVGIYRLAESKDEAAKNAGIMLLSGAGLFVSYDPLVLHTAKRVADPVALRVGFKYSGGFTPGSVASSANIINAGLLVRRDGELVQLNEALPRAFDFGSGPEDCLPTPLGGVVLSYKSTGIKNIEEYFQMALPKDLPEDETLTIATLESPNATRKGISTLLAEVTGANGLVVSSKIDMEEGYAPTVFSAVEIASRTLGGSFKKGFQSPGSAYGEELLYVLPNVQVTDLLN